MPGPNDYAWIRHWATYIGEPERFIVEQQYYASGEGAPLTAIYKRPNIILDDPNKGWKTIEDITSATTREYFISMGLMSKDWELI